MDIVKLKLIKNDTEFKFRRIERLLHDRETLIRYIEDIRFLQHHAGEMVFSGNSGKIGEQDVILRTIKINTLRGCVDVPELLIKLAEKRLIEIDKEASQIESGE